MKTLRALFWGGVAGAALGLLFAPQRGDVTRARLRERQDSLQQDRTRPTAAVSEPDAGLATKAPKSQRHAANKAARDAWETSNGAERNAHETAEPTANA